MARPKKSEISQQPEPRFGQKLVLFQWFLDLLGFARTADLVAAFTPQNHQEEQEEKFFFHQLKERIDQGQAKITGEELAQADANLQRFWGEITLKRIQGGTRPKLLYFQWAALLASELYLHRYFTDPDAFCHELNQFAQGWCKRQGIKGQPPSFIAPELNKLAFWIATGGGKTLIMHVQIKQFMHHWRKKGKNHRYCKINDSGDKSRVILITPNEGMSLQHKAELELSKMEAALFDPAQVTLGGWHRLEEVAIIDVNKLKEKAGVKTIAVESFGENNLILVDEGHKGAGGKVWMDFRQRLCRQGFSFEYSATFGQAIQAAGASDSNNLVDLYSKAILFDYSYRHFYGDGYGKDYQVYNLSEEKEQETRKRYLTGCLLNHFQQLVLYHQSSGLEPFLLEEPLMVFIGGTVTGKREQQEQTDIQEIIAFLAWFVSQEQEALSILRHLLTNPTDLLDEQKRAIFAHSFNPLKALNRLEAEEVYREIKERLFNQKSPSSLLHLVELKGTGSELALQLGHNPPFGVISVGNPGGLAKLVREHASQPEAEISIKVEEDQFKGSLFAQLDSPSSKVKILVGAKKFTEGWNSFRVSTLGLMNVGRGEGAEIIQLFGRGVRLRGLGHCMKRSSALNLAERPRFLEFLETLNVFGVRSEYMKEFQQSMEAEGMTEPAIKVKIPIKPSFPGKLKDLCLWTLAPQTTDKVYKQETQLVLDTQYSGGVSLNWYPRIQSQASQAHAEKPEERLHLGKLNLVDHLAFCDWQKLWLELVRYKSEKSWQNLTIPLDAPRQIMARTDWYELLIPAHLLVPDNFAKLQLYEEIAQELLQKYLVKFYHHQKTLFETDGGQYQKVPLTERNWSDHWELTLTPQEIPSFEGKQAALQNLATKITSQKLVDLEGMALQEGKLHLECFSRHFYYPLAWLEASEKGVAIAPQPLNQGEGQFVADLKAYLQTKPKLLEGKEVFLWRNPSKGEGLGFFEEAGFYPDFMLWIKDGQSQTLIFADPKGMRNESLQSPKVQLFQKLKTEACFKIQGLTLDSYLISVTPMEHIQWAKGMRKEELEANHILFQNEKGYIRTMLEKSLFFPGEQKRS